MRRHARAFAKNSPKIHAPSDRSYESSFLWRSATLSVLMLFMSAVIPQLAVAQLIRGEPLAVIEYDPREDIIFNENGYILKPEEWSEIGDRSDVSGVFDYVVQSGETLDSIAERYALQAQTLSMNNGFISNEDIAEGSVIRIPSADGVLHTVAAGDTLSRIAQEYSSTIEDLRNQNELGSGGSLQIGSTLLIPGAIITEPEPVIVVAAEEPQESSQNNTSAPTTRVINSSPVSAPTPAPVAQQPQVVTTNSTPPPTENGSRLLYPTNRSTSVVTQGFRYGHYALDIARRGGQPIWASASGTVITSDTSGYNGGYGNYVIIDHGNGLQTLYAHFRDVYVVQGQSVSRGQEIGYMGTTGRSTGVHLHYEVRQNGAKMNPNNYF